MATETAPFTRAEVVRDDQKGGKRLYRMRFDDGQTLDDFWSVTTLCGGLPKDALVHWARYGVTDGVIDELPYWQEEVKRWGRADVRNRMADLPYSQSQKAADVGTYVHAQIEAHILGEAPPPVPAEHAERVGAMVKQYHRFAAAYRPEWHASEMTVCHTEHRWAGTLDGVVEIGGRVLLLDAKTTKPQKNGSPGIYLETSCQIAAYRHAEFGVTRSGDIVPMPETDGGVVLWLQPDRYALVEVQAGDAMYRLFRLAAEIWIATDTQRTGWHIVGEIAPPKEAAA